MAESMCSIVRKTERKGWSQSHFSLGSLPAPFLVHRILSMNPQLHKGVGVRWIFTPTATSKTTSCQVTKSTSFFFKTFLKMWSIFKVIYLFCYNTVPVFYVLGFSSHNAGRILAPRDRTHTPCTGRHRTTREVLVSVFKPEPRYWIPERSLQSPFLKNFN